MKKIATKLFGTRPIPGGRMREVVADLPDHATLATKAVPGGSGAMGFDEYRIVRFASREELERFIRKERQRTGLCGPREVYRPFLPLAEDR